MMGKRKLCAGIIFGAVVGGLVTLVDQGVRDYAKGKTCNCASALKSKLKDPASTVKSARMCAMTCHEKVTKCLDETINALEQIEQTLEKVLPKKDPTETR